jgi:hypothetical protein
MFGKKTLKSNCFSLEKFVNRFSKRNLFHTSSPIYSTEKFYFKNQLKRFQFAKSYKLSPKNNQLYIIQKSDFSLKRSCSNSSTSVINVQTNKRNIFNCIWNCSKTVFKSIFSFEDKYFERRVKAGIVTGVAVSSMCLGWMVISGQRGTPEGFYSIISLGLIISLVFTYPHLLTFLIFI